MAKRKKRSLINKQQVQLQELALASDLQTTSVQLRVLLETRFNFRKQSSPPIPHHQTNGLAVRAAMRNPNVPLDLVLAYGERFAKELCKNPAMSLWFVEEPQFFEKLSITGRRNFGRWASGFTDNSSLSHILLFLQSVAQAVKSAKMQNIDIANTYTKRRLQFAYEMCNGLLDNFQLLQAPQSVHEQQKLQNFFVIFTQIFQDLGFIPEQKQMRIRFYTMQYIYILLLETITSAHPLFALSQGNPDDDLKIHALRCALSRPEILPSVLAFFAEHPSELVRLTVLRQPRLPVALIYQKLASIDQCTTAEAEALSRWAARHEQIFLFFANQPNTTLLANVAVGVWPAFRSADSYRAVVKFAQAEDAKIRLRVLRDWRTPAEVLAILVHDPDISVCMTLALSDTTPVLFLGELLRRSHTNLKHAQQMRTVILRHVHCEAVLRSCFSTEERLTFLQEQTVLLDLLCNKHISNIMLREALCVQMAQVYWPLDKDFSALAHTANVYQVLFLYVYKQQSVPVAFISYVCSIIQPHQIYEYMNSYGHMKLASWLTVLVHAQTTPLSILEILAANSALREERYLCEILQTTLTKRKAVS